MKLGLENKTKTGSLAVLFLVLGYAIYSNFFSGPSATVPEPRPAAATPTLALATAPPDDPSAGSRARAQRSESGDFHPVFRSRRPEDRIDPMAVDPTLHLDLLQKLQDAAADASGRNLFQFGAPPPPPPTPAQLAQLKRPEPIVNPQPQAPQAAAPSLPPQPTPPPPIPLKYYGLSTARANGKKIAFFLDGDNILMAGEGELLQKRYLVVRIGAGSVVVQDTQQKREQSIPLAGEADAPTQNSAAAPAATGPEAAPAMASGEPARQRPFGLPESLPQGAGRLGPRVGGQTLPGPAGAATAPMEGGR
jgi:hypothetical protein